MDFWLLTLGCRGLRISCWIVGIGSLSPSLNTCVCTKIVRVHFRCALRVRKTQKPQSHPVRSGTTRWVSRGSGRRRPDRDHFSYDVGGGATPLAWMGRV